MFKSKLIWSGARIVVTLLALSGIGHAQTAYATITGTVTGPSGAPVPKAALTATNVATGISSTTTSNAAGAYTIAQLSEGTYTLKVQASGFREFFVQDVKLESGVVRRLDVLLQTRTAGAIPALSRISSINGPAVGQSTVEIQSRRASREASLRTMGVAYVQTL